MQKRILLALMTLAVATPQNAWASDMSGAVSILFGIPVMLVALAIYGPLAAFRRLPSPVFYCALVLFVPLALFGLAMAVDAAANLGREGGTLISCAYYLLLGVVFLCFANIVLRRLL